MADAQTTTDDYVAFISYRHTPLDRKWAQWLHGALETYRVPAALVRQGYPARLGRVFRDDEELAASSDLTDRIRSSLERAKFLIVVCSPNTPASRWVNEEIERFQALGRSARILALLIEGEPALAFPAALRTSEPLAADIRPVADQSRRERKRIALLKVAAAILDVPYDALRLREDERARRRLRMIAAASLAAAVVFLGLMVAALYQRAQARSRELAAQALEAVWLEPDRAAQSAAQSAEPVWWLSGGPTDESRVAVAAVLRESNVVAVWRQRPSLPFAPITAAGFSHDGRRIVFSTAWGKGWVWDWEQCGVVSFDNYAPLRLRSTAISPDGQLVLSHAEPKGRSRRLVLRAAVTGAQLATFEASNVGAITTVAFSPSGKRLATGSQDFRVRLWNVVRRGDGFSVEWAADIGAHKDVVSSVRFAPAVLNDSDDVLISAGHDGWANIWQLKTDARTPLRPKTLAVTPLRSRTLALYDATFHPRDPNVVVTAGLEGKMFMWRNDSGARDSWKESPAVWAQGFNLREANFSRDGQHIVVASEDATARTFAWPDRSLSLQFTGHRGAVTAAEFSPDGRYVVSASLDGTVRVWRQAPAVTSLRELQQAQQNTPRVHACVGEP